MLSIRLSRKGKKKMPLYSIIVVEKSKDPWGDYIEKLGTYNPHTKEAVLNNEAILSWIGKGAQPTATIHNLLVNKGVIKADKVRAGKTQPGKKKSAAIAAEAKVAADAKAKAVKEAEDKKAADAKAAEEAKAKAEEEAKAAEEAKTVAAAAPEKPAEVPAEPVAEPAPAEAAFVAEPEAAPAALETPVEETKAE